MGFDEVSERSMETITEEHLRRLIKLATRDRQGLFSRNPHLTVYKDRILMVALCQGAAQHYIDATNGIKDLDVYTFYAEAPGLKYPFRRRGVADFGRSELGTHPDHPEVGRHVDLLGRALDVSPTTDPVWAVRNYLKQGRSATAKELAAKAVIGLEPAYLFRTVVWPDL